MSLVVGTNSWVTIAEADTYLTNKMNTTDWFALGDEGSPGEITKENLLVSACRELKGIPTVEISNSTTDDNVKNAQIEYAWYLYKYDEEINDRRAAIHSGVTSFKFTDRSENLDKNNLGIPGFILGMLSDYDVSNNFANLVGEYDI